ncbi:neutral zinc metallopeptidase [Pigmentiphaga sp. GD03639]|uniref:KPN_02809 family neutral zinc metallopeptidase n=1 Tax=unclassified Pigmentiphaga TaxID=2626614 RepID=UPI00104930D1|nr:MULTISPECIES: neutral zinc metallopeptidase [unclassified Pigmentiphaga]MDH2234838.1 neutral zinc metallopeptidase [Pigmentiphaga sp. GD03639]
MRLDNGRESSNIEDRRGGGPRLAGRGSLGIGAVVLALVAMYFGVDPSVVLDLASGPGQSVQESSGPPPADDKQALFVSKVLADTEDTWSQLFTASGSRYTEPKLVLYSGATNTACGTGQAAMGPFYCPGDARVYLDMSFFEEMQRRLNAPGDFARAYVIAHEIGHHVQNLLGTADKVNRQQRRSSQVEANQLSVRMELQADCYAGVWAYHANRARQILEPGDVEAALNAASAIGDDRLQKEAQGYVVPDAFTHGTSAQRVRWFKRGLESGNPGNCDTFSAASL